MSPHQALWSLFKVGEDNFVKFRNLFGVRALRRAFRKRKEGNLGHRVSAVLFYSI